MKPRRSESGHGAPGLLPVIAMVALYVGPPLIGCVVTVVAMVRLQNPWWVTGLVGLGATAAGSWLIWGAAALIAKVAAQ